MGANGTTVSHLQYVDDTMLVGLQYVENLLTIMVVFRNFELTSSLKVNFPKSTLSGSECREAFLRFSIGFVFTL